MRFSYEVFNLPRFNKRWRRMLGASALSLTAMTAWGGDKTDTGVLTVTANIANQCSVGNASLAMGAISLVAAGGTTGALSGGGGAHIPWGCSTGTSATLAFDLGANASGTTRRLASTASSTEYLEYELRSGSPSGVVIGSTPVTLEGANGSNRAFSVWGAPLNSTANKTAKPAGDYTDSVRLTISFAP
jgi:spore coat protein U-like protein